MKTPRKGIRQRGAVLCGRACLVALVLAGLAVLRAAEREREFPTAQAVAEALIAAARTADRPTLRDLFGLRADELLTADPVQATNELVGFVAAWDAGHRLTRESEARYVLEVGANAWPFPIPIVSQGGHWRFDTDAGKEELLNRRIGRNELAVLQVMRAYVTAQREYASQDRDGDQVLEYAQRLASSDGTKDGLYWSPWLDGDLSPFGPLVAEAQAVGYDLAARSRTATREPFHGYYYKILRDQGRHAPGGRHAYVINGNMIAGFALVAWPATYGESGVMAFIVNQQGRVYQRDLGSKTGRVASAMAAYDPAPGWEVSRD